MAKLYRLRVIEGHYRIQHGVANAQGGIDSTVINRGEIFESEHDLAALFGSKFARIDKEELNEVKYSPKREEALRGLQAVSQLTPPQSIEEELQIGVKKHVESEFYRNGDNITIDFEMAKKHKLEVFKVKDRCYVFEAGKYGEPLNPSKGLPFAKVEQFITLQFED